MSEPFGLEDTGAKGPESKQGAQKATGSSCGKIGDVWNTIWSQSLIVKRRGETAIQLPLALAIILAVIFPHAAALVLIIGVVAGYSITVTPK